jgi:hypothetical protein
MKRIISLLVLLSILSGCTGARAGFSAKDAEIVISGVTLKPGMEYTEPALTGWNDYAELVSCAYIGMDRIYTYEKVEVYTYPDGEKDFVLEIVLLDSAATTKGIKVGSTLADVEKAYGDNYTQDGFMIVYRDGQITLSFLVLNDKVEEIHLGYLTE